MEKMPYQPDMDAVTTTTTAATVTGNWREALPVLSGNKVTLRELEGSDAPALYAMLTPEEVSRFISPPPTKPGENQAMVPTIAPAIAALARTGSAVNPSTRLMHQSTVLL